METGVIVFKRKFSGFNNQFVYGATIQMSNSIFVLGTYILIVEHITLDGLEADNIKPFGKPRKLCGFFLWRLIFKIDYNLNHTP